MISTIYKFSCFSSRDLTTYNNDCFFLTGAVFCLDPCYCLSLQLPRVNDSLTCRLSEFSQRVKVTLGSGCTYFSTCNLLPILVFHLIPRLSYDYMLSKAIIICWMVILKLGLHVLLANICLFVVWQLYPTSSILSLGFILRQNVIDRRGWIEKSIFSLFFKKKSFTIMILAFTWAV